MRRFFLIRSNLQYTDLKSNFLVFGRNQDRLNFKSLGILGGYAKNFFENYMLFFICRAFSKTCFCFLMTNVWVKGSLTRDFQLQVFFPETVSSGPFSKPRGPFRIFPNIRGNIRKSRFITGVFSSFVEILLGCYV